MTIEWKDLSPQRPLDTGDVGYVVTPTGTAQAIADQLKMGRSTVLLGGPAGIGKSTELARVAPLIGDTHLACLMRLDRMFNMRKLAPIDLALATVKTLIETASQEWRLPLSQGVQSTARWTNEPGKVVVAGFSSKSAAEQLTLATSALRNAVLEIERLAAPKRLALLVDGLEKVPPGESSGDLFDLLGHLPDSTGLVVVIPWHTAFGPLSDSAVREGSRLVSMRPYPVTVPRMNLKGSKIPMFGTSVSPAERSVINESIGFLGDILIRRLPEQEKEIRSREELVRTVAVSSGGIPRTFLQLMASAGMYARLRRGADWPSDDDLADALVDHVDSFRRLLLKGDVDLLKAVDGTDGLEMELDAKVRLLAHGILLEYERNGRVVVEIHPLVRPIVEAQKSNA